ncbi:MAG: iron uptake protein [Aquabacterium sp.]|uniref:iron uptake protein n=1 Tax=Aquabacterium sp. TaxID=1872578 RepID=UPI0027240963|nr:iron uptake protein [Aquabacterium sp.]MDO9002941.1 iron uptake protein [Aquabacterium sp.]
MSLAKSPSLPVISLRVAAALLGGYAFTWGFSALLITVQMHVGIAYGDALQLAMLLAFLVYLATVCWAFAAASLARVWLVLAGGGATMTVLAWLLMPALG